METINQAFVRNRTEEFGLDLWDTYIIPPYYPKLNLNTVRKSVVLEGGRGCGKTALLRYLSYNSQFSPKRSEIPNTALHTVGLYLKADTQYFSAYSGGDLNDTEWQNIFEHALCLALTEQLIGAIRLLNCSASRLEKYGSIEKLDLGTCVAGFSNSTIPSGLVEFENWARRKRQELSKWFRNPESDNLPELFPLREFLSEIIRETKEKLTYFSDTVFAVYIDEYENLLDYQQRYLNTLIKSGEPPLIFHVAMKPNGMRTRQTIGQEAIQEVADFRKFALDTLLQDNFDLFSAEIFFFRLISAGLPEEQAPVDSKLLRDETRVVERFENKQYRNEVINEINRILPGMRYAEIAKTILTDQTLGKRWSKILASGLKRFNSTLTEKDFFDLEYPDASVVSAILLHQQSKKPNDVHEEFIKLKKGEKSQFRNGDWIHHFLLGAILLMYLPYRQRPCPVYAGFDAYRSLARTNVRHFVELCNLAVNQLESKVDYKNLEIPVDVQALAAAKASRLFKEEVAGCGDFGNRLLAIVNVLGKLFRLSQAKLAQSEPERTHFSIIGTEVSDDAKLVITEAIKWSVLFEEPESKVKGTRYESNDYVLNPIFSPFFGISYNKGRKLEIQGTQAEQVFTGGIEDFTGLLKNYEKAWASADDEQMTLGLDE